MIRFNLACGTDSLGCYTKPNGLYSLPNGNAVGDILVWNGITWYATQNIGNIPNGVNLDDILIWNGNEWLPGSNVSPDMLPNGNAHQDIVVWNGSEWIATTIIDGLNFPLDGTSDFDYLIWNTTTEKWTSYQEFISNSIYIELYHDGGPANDINLTYVRNGTWYANNVITINIYGTFTIESGGSSANIIPGNSTNRPLDAEIIPTSRVRMPVVVEDDEGFKAAVFTIESDGGYYIQAVAGTTFVPKAGDSTLSVQGICGIYKL